MASSAAPSLPPASGPAGTNAGPSLPPPQAFPLSSFSHPALGMVLPGPYGLVPLRLAAAGMLAPAEEHRGWPKGRR
jgi:hypothetical protein